MGFIWMSWIDMGTANGCVWTSWLEMGTVTFLSWNFNGLPTSFNSSSYCLQHHIQTSFRSNQDCRQSSWTVSLCTFVPLVPRLKPFVFLIVVPSTHRLQHFLTCAELLITNTGIFSFYCLQISLIKNFGQNNWSEIMGILSECAS
jgi:hypothetical protein